jgi:hypothetical protein
LIKRLSLPLSALIYRPSQREKDIQEEDAKQ